MEEGILTFGMLFIKVKRLPGRNYEARSRSQYPSFKQYDARKSIKITFSFEIVISILLGNTNYARYFV